MTSFLNQAGLPRGLRNNNPGNLRPYDQWQGMIGTDPSPCPSPDRCFAVFENIAWGIRAMATDVAGDIKNKGYNTIRKLVTEFAPPHENDTNAYIRSVSDTTGIAPDAVIPADRMTLRQLLRAKMNVELGRKYADMISDSDIDAGIALMKSSLLDYFKVTAAEISQTVAAAAEKVSATVAESVANAQVYARQFPFRVVAIALSVVGIIVIIVTAVKMLRS